MSQVKRMDSNGKSLLFNIFEQQDRTLVKFQRFPVLLEKYIALVKMLYTFDKINILLLNYILLGCILVLTVKLIRFLKLSHGPYYCFTELT